MDITLYGYWRSSSSHRLRIALAYKDIAYTLVPVNLLAGEQRAPEHSARAPNAYVPALKIDGEVFTESVAILELLDDLFPAKPLYPREVFARARVRALVETVNAGIQPLQNLGVIQRHSADPDERTAFARHFNERGLGVLERLMEHHEAAGAPRERFAYGDTFTAADVCLIPQVSAAKRFGVDVTSFRRVHAAFEASAALPFVVAAAPERQPDAVP